MFEQQVRKPVQRQAAHAAPTVQKPASSSPLQAAHVLQLQSMYGNRAVSQWLAQRTAAPVQMKQATLFEVNQIKRNVTGLTSEVLEERIAKYNVAALPSALALQKLVENPPAEDLWNAMSTDKFMLKEYAQNQSLTLMQLQDKAKFARIKDKGKDYLADAVDVEWMIDMGYLTLGAPESFTMATNVTNSHRRYVLSFSGSMAARWVVHAHWRGGLIERAHVKLISQEMDDVRKPILAGTTMFTKVQTAGK